MKKTVKGSHIGDLLFLGDGDTPSLLSPKENEGKQKMNVVKLSWKCAIVALLGSYSKKIRATLCAIAVMTGFIAPASIERMDYTDTGSKVHNRELAGENRGFSVVGSSGFSFNVASKLGWPPSDYEITGFRFNIFAGEHVDVYGLDLSVFSSFVKREVGGVQIAGLFNVVGESDCTLQLASACNYCKGYFGGVQIGAVNVIENGRGLQVGLVNSANILYGVQIGIVNYIAGSTLPVAPFFNCAF